MRIICPSCSAAYDVPDSLITPGRVVRCARCGDKWTPVDAPVDPAPRAPPPAAEEAAAETETNADTVTVTVTVTDAAPPSQSAMERLAAHPARPKPMVGLRLAWAASLVALAVWAWAAYAWRTPIMAAWPPSARAYSLFGVTTKN